VAAGGPQVPESLKAQLKIGGRLVIPVGEDQRAQELVRVTRISKSEYRSEDIADVRFVPLIGDEGWATAKEGEDRARARRALRPVSPEEETLVRNLADGAESFPSMEAADLNPLMERIGSARVVLLGEATHGTSEFYRMRERITRDLNRQKGLSLCCNRGGLARRRARRSLRATFSISTFRVDRVRAISDLDVAQQRGAGFRELVAQAQRHCGAQQARRISRP